MLDGLGVTIDGKGPISYAEWRPVASEICNPLTRKRISEILPLGVKAVDGFLTCGKGQRLGVFAGSGVGKSTLLGMMARNTEADVNVVALIGERGREVKDFIEKDLGVDGLKRSVIVVATSDQPPLVRIKGAFVATAIAEYFREQGKDVLLMMDSVTGFAMAGRIGHWGLHPPRATLCLYHLPQLWSGGTSERTITELYTVLVEGTISTVLLMHTNLDGHILSATGSTEPLSGD